MVLEEKYVLAIDSGSTGIRALLFNKQGDIIAREYEKTPPKIEEAGAIEHDPEQLWQSLLSVVRKLFSQAAYNPSKIASIGITNQRGSFCLVEKSTGKPVTNFINWADIRADSVARRMDHQVNWRALRKVAKVVGAITGSAMMNTTSMIHMTPAFALCRLKWLCEQRPDLAARIKKGDLIFCTLDTWFIYKLTGGKRHVTDVTNASGTALYNPFDLKWNMIYIKFFKIPYVSDFFPEVLDTNGQFGTTDPEIFNGVSIPITASVGDQMAALFGHCCFEPGDVKISQGSGAFIDMCVGPKPKLSKRGLFPMIAWRINGNITYMLEGQVTTVGTLIEWLGEGIGISDMPKILNEFAAQTEDTEGVIFIPSPSGLQFPYFNPRIRASFFGLSLSAHRRHVCRAILEGLALSVHDVVMGMEKDTKIPIPQLKVDGGVSRSDIEVQSLADFTQKLVHRAAESDMTGIGAAYLAGLAVGYWEDLNTLKNLKKNYFTFSPKIDATKRCQKLEKWANAIDAVLKMDKKEFK